MTFSQRPNVELVDSKLESPMYYNVYAIVYWDLILESVNFRANRKFVRS